MWYEDSFSSNYNEVEITIQCPNHKDDILVNKKRNEVRERLLNYINRMKVDEKFKKSLVDHIAYTRYLLGG